MSDSATRLENGQELGIQYRAFEIREGSLTEENIKNRTADLVFSTETPVERWFGNEVLSHKKGDVRLGRINTSAPFLMEHDRRDQIGVIEHAKIDGDVGRARVRFSKNPRGEEIWQDVQDGIRSLVSVGYRIFKTVLTESDEEGMDEYRVTDWEPHEISLVSIPADINAGVGRNENNDQDKMPVEVVLPDGGAVSVGSDDRSQESNDNQKPSKIKIMDNNDNAPTFDAEAERKKMRDELIEQTRKYDEHAKGVEEHAKNTQLKDGVVRGLIEKHRTNADINALRADFMTALGDPANIETVKPVEMGEKEIQRYSLCRAIQRKVEGLPLDGLEGEMHDEVQRGAPTGVNAEGFFAPIQVTGASSTATRAIGAASGTEGNETVATDVGDLIDILRDNLVLAQLGATQLTGLTSNVSLPRQTATATVAWDAEADALSESSPTFDTVDLSPKRAGVQTYFSKQLMIQSSLDVENLVRRDQGQGLARVIQNGMLYGTGPSDQPTGLVTDVQANGNTVTFGAAPTWAKYVEAWRTVAVDNGAMGRLAYLTTPLGIEKGATIPKVSGTSDFIIEGNPATGLSSWGFPVGSTTTLTDGTDSNLLVFGNWQELIWAMFGNGFDVVVDPYTRAGNAQIVVTTNAFVDAGVRHPDSFCCSTDSAAQ